VKALALVALVACGSPHHGSDAAGGGDDGPSGDGDGSGGMIDAPPPDVPNVRGTVKVTVTNPSVAGCQLPQLHVVFVDVDSTTTDLIADAAGKAQADVFPGASVTAVCERSTGTDIAVTVQDVEPGDDITLDGSYFFTGSKTADQTLAGTFKISFPTAPGATNYTIYYPCGNNVPSGNTNVSLTMKAGCLQQTMDLVVVSGTSSGPTQWTEAANVPYVNGGSVTVTDTWHPFGGVTASYTNAPAFCADSARSDYPCDVQLARYVPELHGLRATGMTNLTASGMVAVTSPTSSSAIMQSRLENLGPAYQVVTDVVDGSQTTYAIDFSARLLPWMCLGTAQCPGFDGAAAKLTIPVTGTGAYDLFETDVTFSRGPQFTQILIWRVFGPTAGDVTFPTLPSSVSVMNPQSVDRQSVTHSRICESSALNGWRDARQNPFDSLATCTQSTNPTAPRYGGTHNRLSASQ